jgi:hypothetical protein
VRGGARRWMGERQVPVRGVDLPCAGAGRGSCPIALLAVSLPRGPCNRRRPRDCGVPHGREQPELTSAGAVLGMAAVLITEKLDVTVIQPVSQEGSGLVLACSFHFIVGRLNCRFK